MTMEMLTDSPEPLRRRADSAPDGNRTLACLAHRFYWSGMSYDVKEWLTQCVACVKRKAVNR